MDLRFSASVILTSKALFAHGSSFWVIQKCGGCVLSLRVAFYPCCCRDVVKPVELVQPYADQIVFCDIDEQLKSEWQQLKSPLPGSTVQVVFRIDDARKVIASLDQIDVLFYRGDSEGEGGSGLFVLGDSVLPNILAKFPSQGGLIITDGSNSRGSNFKRMIRRSGLRKHGWHFNLAQAQPLLESHGLHIIAVLPDTTAT